MTAFHLPPDPWRVPGVPIETPDEVFDITPAAYERREYHRDQARNFQAAHQRSDMTKTATTLTPAWVDQILVTAFDGSVGGCWYWINEEDEVDHVRMTTAPADAPEFYTAARVLCRPGYPDGDESPSDHYVKLDAESLGKAVDWIMTDEHLAKTETANQIRSARAEDPDDCGPDLDAEAADVIVQVAMFGKIVFG